jgi:signal transduction histidine kinase/CheY-like chemotaxis protein
LSEDNSATRQPCLSLAGKLIIMSVLIILGVSLLFWYPSIVHMQKEELHKNINFAESQMDVIKRALYYGMLTNRRDYVGQTVNSLATTENILWIKVLDAHGVVRFSSIRSGFDVSANESPRSGNGRSRFVREVEGGRAVVMTEPILNAPSCYIASCHIHSREEKELGEIEFAFSLQSADAYIRKQGYAIGAFGVVFIIVLSIPLYLVVHHVVLAPVSRLTEGIRKVAAGDLSHAINVDSKDEFGILADNFNAMTGKLKERTNAITKELDEHRLSLLHAQKMEAIGTLSAGIAHDFNNLLKGIIGYSELALEECQAPGVKEYLGRVLELTEKATDFTRQILLIGRKLPATRQPVNMNHLIEDSMKMLRRMVEETIEIRVSPKANIRPVDGDPSQITQVVMNLVVNARDAINKGGVIEIRTGDALVDEEYCRHYVYAKPGHYVTVAVKDTGEGIPEEIRDRIFEPFFSTKTKGKGTGLGLAVTYSIVKAHGGWINLYSEVGKGSEFRVYLPTVAAESVPDKTRLQKQELPRGTETILLADDEELIRALGSSILKGLGYNVITAVDGEDVVRIYGERRADISLVLMDRVMPKVDGIEAYRLLKGINPGVKVIISSGYAADEAGGLRESGVLGFLDKPYRVAEMAKIVRKALDGEAV